MCKLKTQAGTAVLTTLILSLFISCSRDRINPRITDEHKLDRYNYQWATHSSNAAGSMPIGNGDLAANVYVCDGALYLLLSKSDAFDREGNLIKTGRIKITAQPNPFTEEGSFSQLLHMVSGAIEIEQNGVFIRVWCDANHPVYQIDILSDENIRITAEPEFWKRSDGDQDKRYDTKKSLIWTHSNTQSDFSEYLAEYGIEELAESYPDPFLYVTTGNLVESPQMKVSDGQLQGSGKRFKIRIHGMRAITENIQPFISDLEELSFRNKKNTSWEEHVSWWSGFWERSWIIVSDNSIAEENREICTPPQNYFRTEPDGGFVVAQNYNMQRYMMACMSRGGCQTQFNGGLFTTNITLARHDFDEDGRLWGRRFTFQNQRLLYWPMIHAGDYDLMDPFFNYYTTVQPLKKAFTRLWFGHEGSYFRENIQLSGDEISEGKSNGKPPRTKEEANYQKGWHNFHFNSTLEIPYMALRRYQHTYDENFKNEVMLPLAREGLLFYDKHYQRDTEGKIRLEPSQALETYWEAVNNTPGEPINEPVVNFGPFVMNTREGLPNIAKVGSSYLRSNKS